MQHGPHLFILFYFKKKQCTVLQRPSLTNTFQQNMSLFISVPASVCFHVPHFLENFACLCLGGAHFRHNVSTAERTEQIRTEITEGLSASETCGGETEI